MNLENLNITQESVDSFFDEVDTDALADSVEMTIRRSQTMLKIDLDDEYTIMIDRWGYPILIKHKAGEPARKENGKGYNGKVLYYQTFGSVVKSYIMMRASTTDIHTLNDTAKFIDLELKSVEKKIDQQMEKYKEVAK